MVDQTLITAEKIGDFRRTITDEIFVAMGMGRSSWQRRVLSPLFWLAAQRFARLAVNFDAQVEQGGMCGAARWILPRFVSHVETRGEEQILEEGPLLITSNHPGTYDGFATLCRFQRKDIKILASDIPFSRSLPSTSRQLIFVSPDPRGRISAVRSTIEHLQQGGAVLLYPSGNVDPDPAFLPGSQAAVQRWSPSIELILRKAPQTKIQVVFASGVLAPASMRNPLIRLRSGEIEQQKLAEFFQIIAQMLFNKQLALTPQVTFGVPVTMAELCPDASRDGLLPAVIEYAQDVLETHLNWIYSPSQVGQSQN